MTSIIRVFIICSLFFLTINKVSAQWNVSGNFNGGNLNALHIKAGSIYAGTSSQGIFRSDNDGLNWMQINSGLGTLSMVQCINSNDYFVFAGTSSGGIYYTVDGGSNWVQSNQGINQLNIKALITDDSSVFAGCIFAGIFRSSNNGSSWYRWGLGEGDLLSSLSYNDHAFFVGLNGGMYRTTNFGQNWSIAHNGITNLDIKCLAQAGNRSFCGTFGGGVFVSENNGVSWTSLSAGLENSRVQVLTSDGTSLFAGTLNNGIFCFNNISNSWISVNNELPDTNIFSIALNEEFIFAGTSTGKVWKRSLNEIITAIHNPENEHITDYHLFQNYPNPFNPVTNISFYIPERQFVTLTVYDNLGKEISEIYSGFLAEGNHTRLFNAEEFAAGVYYYKLSTADFEDVKKMVIVK